VATNELHNATLFMAGKELVTLFIVARNLVPRTCTILRNNPQIGLFVQFSEQSQ